MNSLLLFRSKIPGGRNAKTYLEEEISSEPHKNGAGLAEWLSCATHLHLNFNASLRGQEQYNVNRHLGGLSEFMVSAQMVPTTPNPKSFPKNVFFILVQVLFSCSLHSSGLGTHFIFVSAVGLQKHSTGRICLLPGECWVPPELLVLVTVFIRLYMSSLVSQVILKKSPPSTFSDLDLEARRLLGCALMAHSLLGSSWQISHTKGKDFLSLSVASSQMLCFDFVLIYYPEPCPGQISGISTQADFTSLCLQRKIQQL